MKYHISELYVEPSVRKVPFVAKALEEVRRLQGELKICSEPTVQNIPVDPLEKDKIYLLSYPGQFLKPCPGTVEHICCGYQILNVGTNCPMDCSYCILQSYFNQPGLRIFANIEQGLEEVLGVIDSAPQRIFRVGTGEFTDSLALDPMVGWTGLLLPEFSRRKNAILELKTKTDNINGILETGIRDRIVVSWSLNSPKVASHEEHRAPSIKKRLEAARICQKEGYVIGFHFDPLFHYPGWQEDYLETVEMIDKYIEPKGIIWISMGTFRFMPHLKQIIRRRHPDSFILDGEFVPGKDGKMRYYKPIRVELYSYVKELLEQWSLDLGLYLCMEAADVWEVAMGWNPEDSEGLGTYLDQRVKKIFG